MNILERWVVRVEILISQWFSLHIYTHLGLLEKGYHTGSH